MGSPHLPALPELLQDGSSHPMPNFDAPPAALAGLTALYSDLVWPRKALRADFLKGLLRGFKPVVAMGAEAGNSVLHELAFTAGVLAALPLQRNDEILLLVHEVDGLVCTHAEDVLCTLKAGVKGNEVRHWSKTLE